MQSFLLEEHPMRPFRKCFLVLLFGAVATLPTLCVGQTVTTFDVLVATETLTVVGTTTFQGNAFSVGGSTFVVTQGNVGIGTTTPLGQLHAVAPGSTNASSQFLWIPSSAAFRIGSVSGTQWSPSNIGIYSIAFGQDNKVITNFASVLGGSNNLIQLGGDYSLIGGGVNNTSESQGSVVSGGEANEATAVGAAVSGGISNLASGASAFVGGGSNNIASGSYASAIGGNANTASGADSFAAGTLANAAHVGAFVWADDSCGGSCSFQSTAPNEFRARATGGFVLASSTAATVIVSSGSITISTSATAVTAAPNIFISSTNGNVGLATSSPNSKLDVNGDTTLRGALTSTSTGTIQGQDASGYSLKLSSGLSSGGCIKFGDGTQQCTASSSASGVALLVATQTFSGGNTFSSSTTLTSGGRDIVLSTGNAPGAGAIKIVGNTGAVQISTGVVFLGIKAPTSSANQGVLYYDADRNAFYVSENGAAAKPIVDPPGNWTCTIRTGSGCTESSATNCTDTVSCVGNEKAISGGCSLSTSLAYAASAVVSHPTGQGWSCTILNQSSSYTITATANCCQ